MKQHTLDQAENLIKQHEAFITTMDANSEKISHVLQFATKLEEEGNYAQDRVHEKADNIKERYIVCKKNVLKIYKIMLFLLKNY